MKYVNFPITIETAADNTPVASAPVDASQLYKMSAQVVVTDSSITSSLQLQVSNDELNAGYLNLNQPVNWSDLGSPLSIAAPGVFLIEQQDLCYRSIRFVLTNSDSTAHTALINVMALAI